jgi:hypothetical protein
MEWACACRERKCGDFRAVRGPTMRRGPSPQAAYHDGDCFRTEVMPVTMPREKHMIIVCIVDRFFKFVTFLLDIARSRETLL